jgi:hypothetical protein
MPRYRNAGAFSPVTWPGKAAGDFGGATRVLEGAVRPGLAGLPDSAHIFLTMANTFVGMPMVEVVAPDGRTELWAAAVAHSEAVAAVQTAVPEGYIARATNRRLLVGPKLEGFRRGEVRRVEP